MVQSDDVEVTVEKAKNVELNQTPLKAATAGACAAYIAGAANSVGRTIKSDHDVCRLQKQLKLSYKHFSVSPKMKPPTNQTVGFSAAMSQSVRSPARDHQGVSSLKTSMDGDTIRHWQKISLWCVALASTATARIGNLPWLLPASFQHPSNHSLEKIWICSVAAPHAWGNTAL